MYYLLIKSKFLNNRVIQASGLNGPIPLHIASLENLSDLSVWLYKSVAIYCFIGNCILFYFNFLLLFKFRYLGELVTWEDLKQIFRHLIIWQRWQFCELDASIKSMI